MPRRREPGFIWIPPARPTKWSIIIDGTNVSDTLFSGVFSRGIIGEDLGCEIELDNSNEQYTDFFTFGDVIQVKADFSDGSTIQWEGVLEEQQKKLNDNGFVLLIRGSHYTGKLLDVTVNKQFTSSEVSSVLTSIITEFLPGFTFNGVQATSETADTITWNNKPFFDCVYDLMQLATFDCYVDDDKDFKFFERGSRINDNEAMVWDDGLFELRGLGQDSIDVRNRTIVYGESDGLPVISTTDDDDSQDTYGIKERIIKDTSISNEDQADGVGLSENESNKNPETKGTGEGYLLPTIKPGDSIYVIYPPQNVHDRYRAVGYTLKFPEEKIEVNFAKMQTVPKLFKDRQKAELRNEKITNPFQMKHSFNFSFDDLSKIDTASSINIEVSEGFLKTITGNDGTMISTTKTTASDVSKVHLKVIGDSIAGNTYFVSADGGVNFQQVTTEMETTITNTGSSLKLKVILASSDARLDAVALLYK
jgi:hypothetical protein